MDHLTHLFQEHQKNFDYQIGPFQQNLQKGIAWTSLRVQQEASDPVKENQTYIYIWNTIPIYSFIKLSQHTGLDFLPLAPNVAPRLDAEGDGSTDKAAGWECKTGGRTPSCKEGTDCDVFCFLRDADMAAGFPPPCLHSLIAVTPRNTEHTHEGKLRCLWLLQKFQWKEIGKLYNNGPYLTNDVVCINPR